MHAQNVDEIDTRLSLTHAHTQEGVNFTNILCAAFKQADPRSAKKYSQVIILFCAFGICAQIKALSKMLVKLTTGVPTIRLKFPSSYMQHLNMRTSTMLY